MSNLMKRFYTVILSVAIALCGMLPQTSFAAVPLHTKSLNGPGANSSKLPASLQKGYLAIRPSRPLSLDEMFGLSSPGARRIKSQTISKATASLPEGIEICGTLLSSTPTHDKGVYKMSASGLTPLYTNPDMFYRTYGTVWAGTKYWVVKPEIDASGYLNSLILYTLSTEDWSTVSTGAGNIYYSPVSLAYDPTSQRVLTCGAYLEGDYYLAEMDINTGIAYHIADLPNKSKFSAMAFSAEGELYAFVETGFKQPYVLAKVDKNTGEQTVIGSTGINSYYFFDNACIDPNTDQLYFFHADPIEGTDDAYSAIYSVNKETGAATEIGQLPDNAVFIGTYIEPKPLAGNLPGPATNIKAQFIEDTMDGTVTFTVPSTLADGTPATGRCQYKVKANGKQVSAGNVRYGETKTVNITVDRTGYCDFIVILSNENGRGGIAGATAYAGAATPTPAKDVNLSYADNKLDITWTAARPASDGYFNPDEVSYKIMLLPDSTILTETARGTHYMKNFAAPDTFTVYQALVTASYKGMTTTAAKSNKLSLGSVKPPYLATMEKEYDADGYVFEDVNGDGSTWSYSASDKAIEAMFSFDELPMNDWAFLPPVKLEKGKLYKFSFDARAASAAYEERVEAKVGLSPKSTAMTTELIAPTTVTNKSANISAYFQPETDGIYYFGIHGISDPDKHRLMVSNIAVSAPIEGSAPAAPSNFKVTRNTAGQLKATISVSAPRLDAKGQTLASLEKLEILRDNEVIKTFEAPNPGSVLTHIDNTCTEGEHTYAAVAYNAFGAGLQATASVFIGFDKPSAPVVKVVAGTGDGDAVISWDAVTTDKRGQSFPDGKVKYNVYRAIGGQGVCIAKETSDLTLSDNAVAPDANQVFVTYGVEAVYETKTGDMGTGDILALGKPYTLPYRETFNSRSQYLLAMGNNTPGTYWGTVADNYGVHQQDDNGSMAVMSGLEKGATAILFTGKLKIDGIEEPKLSFYYFDDEPSTNTLEVVLNDGTGWKSIHTVTLGGENASMTWKRVVVDLKPWLGKDMMLGFRGTVVDTRFLYLDNIRVGEIAPVSLEMMSFDAPEKAYTVNGQFTVTAKVANEGLTAINADQYEVAFFRDGGELDRLEGVSLQPGESTAISFGIPLDIFAPELHRVRAEIITDALAADDKADNKSVTMRVSVVKPNYPAVSDLSATRTDTGVALAWSAPQLNPETPTAVEDGAETYKGFSIGLPHSELASDDFVGDWTMVDADGSQTYGIQYAGQALDYENAGLPMAFQIIDYEELGDLAYFQPHSGKGVFVSFASVDKQNDDWMISPELPAIAQEISLYAKSAVPQYGYESFEVLTSPTGKELSDFTLVGAKVETVPSSWTEYKFNLPAGTRYFAIRCTSDNVFALLIDDIKFTARDMTLSTLEIEGYNVYRKNKAVSQSLVVKPAFDTEYVDTEKEYCVTVKYNHGESLPSNIAIVGESGISAAVTAAATAIGIEGRIAVTGAQGLDVTVCTPDGKLMTALRGKDSMEIAAAPGIYIVTLGTKAVKVAVW